MKNWAKKEKRREDRIRERAEKTGRSWHVSRGVTWSTQLIRAVKEWERRRKGRKRGGAGLDRHRHEHISQLQIIRFPQVADVLKQTTHTHTHTHTQMRICWHTGPRPPGNRCKPRHTCRNTNSLIDITDVHAHAHMLGREEIPQGTGGSGDSNLSGWLWSSPCLCHHCWKCTGLIRPPSN